MDILRRITDRVTLRETTTRRNQFELLRSRHSELDTAVSGVTREVWDLQKRSSDHQDEIVVLQNSIADLTDDTTSTRTDLSTIEDRVEALEKSDHDHITEDEVEQIVSRYITSGQMSDELEDAFGKFLADSNGELGELGRELGVVPEDDIDKMITSAIEDLPEPVQAVLEDIRGPASEIAEEIQNLAADQVRETIDQVWRGSAVGDEVDNRLQMLERAVAELRIPLRVTVLPSDVAAVHRRFWQQSQQLVARRRAA